MYGQGSFTQSAGGPNRPVSLRPNSNQAPTRPSSSNVQQGQPVGQSAAYMYQHPLPPPPPRPPTSSVHPAQAPPSGMPVTSQTNVHSSQTYPTSQHNSQHGNPNVYQSLQQVPSLGQSHLPPRAFPPLPSPSVSSQGQPLYRPLVQLLPKQPDARLSNFPTSTSVGSYGALGVPPPPPPLAHASVEKAVPETHVTENVPLCSGLLDQEHKSASKNPVSVPFGSPKTKEPSSHTFADSDTEMEDDITRPEDDQEVNYSTGAPTSAFIPGDIDKKDQLTKQPMDASSENHNKQLSLHDFSALNSFSQGDNDPQEEPLQQEKDASPRSARAQNFLGSGGDMYDPFSDCIEPSSNLSEKFSHVQKCEPPSDSVAMVKLSVSSKPPDVEENNWGNDIGAVVPAPSVDNEACGENANAEVCNAENGSSDSPDEVADTNSGEVDSGQKKSREKSKTKDSRSMRLFKVVLTEFVKDLLKPSWRQGNMSKEAFKTIVKKTVDKVSGAMEGRRIPKSRAKIDKYIDSSQQKLTKLVMSYVDKYVKA